MDRAKRVRRRLGMKWVWAWDTTPWGGGYIVDNGVVGGAILPNNSLLNLRTGEVTTRGNHG